MLLARAKVARDVIPRELRKLGARVDVVEAYETVVPPSSRQRLRAALASQNRRPDWITFTSSSTVKKCKPCEGGVAPYTAEESQQQLKQLKGWRITPDGKRIRKEWTVKNFMALVDESRGRVGRDHTSGSHKRHLKGVRLASIGPVTSSTLRELGLPVDVEAAEYTIPGLIKAISSGR